MGAPVNFGDQAQVLNLLPVAAVTVDGNGTGVDLQALEGEICVVLDVSAPVAGTNPTMDCKIQESDASGSGYTDVSGGAFAQVAASASLQQLSLNKAELKRYIRIVKDISGTSSPQYLMSAKVIGIQKYPA